MLSRCFVALFSLLILCGCATDSSNLARRLDTHHQYITEIDTRLKKLEAEVRTLKEENARIRRETQTLENRVKKTSPGYAEGSIQEGTR